MAEQVLPVCSSAAFTDTPASLGGAETGGRSLGGGGGTGGHEKGQGRVRVERRGVVKEVERSTLGLRLQRGERTVSQHVEEKGKQPYEDHQVSFVTFLAARVCQVRLLLLLSRCSGFFFSPPPHRGLTLSLHAGML